MTRLSLHIGLNTLDMQTWGPQKQLNGCENDAKDMSAVARSRGFSPDVLRTAQATVETVWARMVNASAQLVSGDYFFLTYSGHGSQLKNDAREWGEDEPDGLDETWCLYNGHLLDDMLYAALCKFARGVRVFVMSDSCHSGTVTRGAVDLAKSPRVSTSPVPTGAIAKFLPLEVTQRAFDTHKSVDERSADWPLLPKSKPLANAKVVLISGCRDHQESLDLGSNGAMTAAFLRIWDNGSYDRNFNHLVEGLQRDLESYGQTPDLFAYGWNVQDMVLQVPLSD